MQLDPQRLRRALDDAGMSAARLADELDISRSYISHWLTGRREPPEKYLEPIADILKVDRAWLAGRDRGDEADNRTGEESKVGNADRPPHVPRRDAAWHFRQEPADGGRDYGSANVWALPADISSLVRETGQNSLDHAVGHAGKVQMRFSLIELTKGSDEYEEFVEAVGFDDLLGHIEEAAKTQSKLSTRLRGGLKRVRQADRMRLLRIDDYGTTGLFGREKTSEERDSNPFAALVRNNLDSSKRSTTAGGSFGLGKAVLWRCSSLSTVFFASDITESERSQDQPTGTRTVGKAELTWHRLGDESLAGPGWYGIDGTEGDSMWVDNSELERLQLSRSEKEAPPGVEPARSSGTSILLLGFQDPESEDETDASTVLEKIERAVAVNFWPVMVKDRLHVSTEHIVDGEPQDGTRQVDPMDYVFELCDAVIRHEANEVDEELIAPGDVVRIPVTHRIPATDDDTGELQRFPDELEATAQLVVRLAGDDELGSDQLNKVALVRGRGMVVKYWRRNNLVVGASPFHAVLLAGRAAGTDSPNIAAEQFLRLAEPPAHNDWKHTGEVKERYEHGSGVRLQDVFDGTSKQLKKVIKPRPSGGEEGPDELKRLLQLTTSAPSAPPPATLRRIRQEIRDGRWHIRAEIHMNDRSRRRAVTPRLRINAESGKKVEIPWEEVEIADTGHGSASLEGDALVIEPETRRVRFAARSAKEADGIEVAHCSTKLDLRVKELSQNEDDN